MSRKLVRWIALITVIVFFAVSIGIIGFGAIFGR